MTEPFDSAQHCIPPELPDEKRTPIRGLQRRMATAMVASAFGVPHVTEFLAIDVSATMAARDRLATQPQFLNVKVSPLLFIACALIRAIARTPTVNGYWDQAAGETVAKRHVNLGIAAATPRGLIVPNIKNAEQLSGRELASALAQLASTARAGKTTREEMTGGTITISNIGIFGVDSATPILNPGESTILAVGSIRRAPWVVTNNGAERIEARWITELSLSFDHRLIDGQTGSRLLADVGAALHDPSLLATLVPAVDGSVD